MKEMSFTHMKDEIAKAGGLFYQYRPCRRDAYTIYDIENIQNGVVYAQTPLNMNDPFDSMIGYSPEYIYENCIKMLIDCFDIDDNVKSIIVLFMKYKAFGKLANFISELKELKDYLLTKQKSMHKTNLDFKNFVSIHKKELYNKLPKKLKSVLDESLFIVYTCFVINLINKEISELSVAKMIEMDDTLEEIHQKTKEIMDEIYFPRFKDFLSKLTVSCFSSSGWNNQLMWAHYANSYSGICVEYDFNKIEKNIGFIYPVTYTNKRPTLSLQDIGISGFSYEDKKAGVNYCDIDMNKFFSYLLSKNECWSYEKEWRIINFGESNTPILIELRCIKSITFGLKVDKLCKKLLLEVCKENGIECYNLTVDKEEYRLDRERIDFDKINYDFQEEMEFVTFLLEKTTVSSERFIKDTESVTEMLNQGNLERGTFFNFLSELNDYICNAYFIKLSFNRICHNWEEKLGEENVPDEIKKAIIQINGFVEISKQNIEDLLSNGLLLMNFLKYKDYLEANRRINEIDKLIQSYFDVLWHDKLISDTVE